MNSYPMPHAPCPMPHSGSAYISNIILSNYRNHRSLSLNCAAPAIILTGPNGAGKTNILEAISLFAPGRGLRSAAGKDFFNVKSQNLKTETEQPAASLPWSVVIDLTTPHSTNRLGTGVTKITDKTRAIQADEKPIAQTELSEYLTIAWATPDMDRLWVDAASSRRRFLDRLVYAINPLHWAELNRLDKSRAERIKLLENTRTDDGWLGALESAIAESSVQITQNRLQYIAQLNRHIGDFAPDFPSIALSLNSMIASTIANHSPSEAALIVAQKLRAARERDAISGHSSIGAHRDDIAAWHGGKNRNAADCSTGEQKIALLSVLLAHAALVMEMQSRAPILLLDEINAHLDDFHRTALARVIGHLRVQAWLSGADQNLFADWRQNASFFSVGSDQ